MNSEEIGEFLYRFYRKRTSSFLANSYKATITGNLHDIHRVRLDVKKIYALYELFEMLDPKAFRYDEVRKLFKPIHRAAGKIREIQVNCLLLEKMELPDAVHASFMAWLREKERFYTVQLIYQVKKFREPELTLADDLVHKICHSSTNFRLRSKTMKYIRIKASQIRDLLSEEPEEEDIHRIRKCLKTMSTITTLVYPIRPGEQLDQILSELNKIDMMIGDWHDQAVLKKAIESYLEDKSIHLRQELISLDRLKDFLIAENKKLREHFVPEVIKLVEAILTEKD